MSWSRVIRRPFPFLILPLVFTCSPQDAVRPTAPSDVAQAQAAASNPHHPTNERFVPLPPAPPLPQGWSILECGYTNRKVVRVSPEGGYVGIDVALLTIRPHAVDRTVQFTMIESETRVEATIDSDAGHLGLQRPAELVMSYNRCGISYHPAQGKRLSIWRYRPETGWENLGGVIDPVNQTIRVRINALSRFAVAEG